MPRAGLYLFPCESAKLPSEMKMLRKWWKPALAIVEKGKVSGAHERLSVRLQGVSDPAALLTQVERGNMAAGVVIPPGYDGAVRAGHAATLRYLARPDQSSQRLGETVRGAVVSACAARSVPAPGSPVDAAGVKDIMENVLASGYRSNRPSAETFSTS